MADDVRVVIDQAAFARLLQSEEGPVGRELMKRTLQAEGTAKRLCPVDTGRLRSSINHELERDAEGLVGKVGTNVEYGPHVEFGTVHTRAQPFLRPALYKAAGGR